jgi:hypothetical protein
MQFAGEFVTNACVMYAVPVFVIRFQSELYSLLELLENTSIKFRENPFRCSLTCFVGNDRQEDTAKMIGAFFKFHLRSRIER